MKQLKVRLRLLLITSACILLTISAGFCMQTFGRGEKVVIGAKNCTEQHVVSELLSQLIERETDIQVVRKFNLEGTTICFNALKSKTIDIYVEYTGTAVLDILKEPILSGSLFDYVKETFQSKYGIIWLDRLGFSNQYVLITRRDLNLMKISDLETNPGLQLAYDQEFAARLEAKLLKAHYNGISYKKLMDNVLLYFSLASGSVDVISGFSTGGRLADPRFVVLEDDRGALPTYEAAPMITEECLEKHPELERVLRLLKGAISTEEMSRLNYLVEIEGRDVKSVASDFLKFGLKDRRTLEEKI